MRRLSISVPKMSVNIILLYTSSQHTTSAFSVNPPVCVPPGRTLHAEFALRYFQNLEGDALEAEVSELP
jgi:hypothetical protein